MIRRSILAVVGVVLIASTGGPADVALAYEPDEARAIVTNRPETPIAGARRVILATQRMIESAGMDEMMTHDHILWAAGPDLDDPSMRWTFRPGVEDTRMREGYVHRSDGTTVEIPRDSARVEPCRAAGPGGYPGISDYVVHPPDPAPGDVVEVILDSIHRAVWRSEIYAGEHSFAAGDSVIESELILRTPVDRPARAWWFGNVPEPRSSVRGSLQETQWLLGNLSPAGEVERSGISVLPVEPADSLGPPVLRFAFPVTWEMAVEARRRIWTMCMRATPDTLAAVAQAIAVASEERGRRTEEALAWCDRAIAHAEIPSARGWFEPENMQGVLDRGKAIPRDRAALLVWLLRRLGVAADVATVSSKGPLVTGLVFPQQLDAWVVYIHAPGAPERWIDMRGPARSSGAIPAGHAVVWTAPADMPVLVPFPGLP